MSWCSRYRVVVCLLHMK